VPAGGLLESFAARVLRWHKVYGRHDFPWQLARTPYRVWLSEVMLQQTQAATVIPYFERFVARFPDLQALAEAELDDVLALWSGLGYYARGRNLHASARICADRFGGQLPDDAVQLEALPGIGRSTANAIVAQAFNRRAPILDGNVKRVLARHAGIGGWPGRSAVLANLWAESEQRTPKGDAANYTQAIMDLGATVCTARQPACNQCPVAADCIARLEDRTGDLPGRKPPRIRPVRAATFLLLQDEAGRVLLERRPPAGIWGGLWCLPDQASFKLPAKRQDHPTPTVVQHDFTHFRLNLHLRHVSVSRDMVKEGAEQTWMDRTQALEAGLPRPVRQIIEDLIR
jgi:A/G-specific adenine glycosylase